MWLSTLTIRNLETVLRRLTEHGFSIRKEKCQFSQAEVKCLGHILPREWILADPKRVEAIVKMPALSDASNCNPFWEW
ncbi:hypothetical protein M513_03111 [Trichuris suis]|uniref:Reverse transcriptase domain-containing protein n=1 Tax=Trichuris suis TaxID=68888 RepID=A0A085MFJ1_9BILA|nr:hypothetical protein M513_03111 [Trichuris suis]